MRDFLAARGSDPDAQAVGYLLFRVSADFRAALEAGVLRAFGLTHAGFVLLMTLWITGPRETRELAGVQRVSRPAIVSSVDTLERSGLVERVRSDVDRRLVSVRLTRTGRSLIGRVQTAFHAQERRIASALTPREQRALAALLRRIDASTKESLQYEETA